MLAGVKAALDRKPVADHKVWSGYPWPEGVEDEDVPHVHVGLFEHQSAAHVAIPAGVWQRRYISHSSLAGRR